ncbi:hypothetical protein RHMOL_Rhmol04G0372000 [Rhododendron molle]|uniref:Uncharacterized protein n=1 Tax=Rhododendron molle TaxID=49168 RepID=A0ACC0P9J7_RHOML|nr:hypothetical protein RHMOL_Rhmol04G0372000 [Rhododendron molle]
MEDIDDDDFGDLYADVEFQASTTINGQSSDDFATKCIDSGSKGSEELVQDDQAKREFECERGVDSDGSDSEDDLNIVLNDDEGNDGGGGGLGVSVSQGVGLGFDEDEEEEGGGFEGVEEGDDGLVKNRSLGGLEASPNGRRGGGERGNEPTKGGYKSQFLQYKYMRHRGASFPTNAKANGYTGLGSFSSTSARGDWDNNKCSLRMDSSSLTAQIGHNFSLPRYRTILDVNIGALERKSWRHPGADITDFFNFGFDEESWKLYCNSVEQLRQRTSLQTRATTYGYPKAKEVYGAEAQYETEGHMDEPEKLAHLQGAVSPVSRCAYREGKQFEMPKGRVIQVEDSILERQASMDVRRIVDRDPDVVIQIAVQDCVESVDNSCGSGKGESTQKGSARESSENGDFGLDDDLCHFGGGSGDEMSSKLLEGDVKRSGRPYPKRYPQLSTPSNSMLVDFDNHASGQISDVDGCRDRKVTGSSSEGQAEAMETSNNTNEKVCSETYNAALSFGETDSLLGDQTQQELSSSISGSHVEASGNFASVDPERVQNHLWKESPDSVEELHESLTSDYRQSIKSKSHQDKTKTGDGKYYSRNRSPFPKDRRHYSSRLHYDSELKRRYDYEESCPFPYTDDNYYGRLQAVYSCDGEGFPYYTESELPCNYFGEWFSHNEAHAAYSKRSRRNHHNFGDEKDQYPSRRWDEREHFLEQRGSRLDDEVVGRDWYTNESRITLNPPFRKEPRRLGSNYSSYSDKGSTRWSGKGDEFHFRKRGEQEGYLLDSNYEDYFLQEKYGYCGKERKYLHGKYERQWPSNRRGGKIPRRHFSRQSCTTNRGRGFETISRRGAYDLRLTERHGEHSRRQIVKERNRGIDYFGSNHGAGESEGRVYCPDGEDHHGRRRNWQYDSFHCTKDEYIYSYKDDEFLAEEESFSFRRTLRNASIGGKQKLLDNVEVDQHIIKLVRGGSSNNRVERSSNITDRGNHEKPLLRCRDSVDLQLVGGEGKSSGRCSNAGSIECNDKHENMDQMVFADLSESHAEKAGETENTKVEINQNGEQWLDKFPITEHNEALDIEEGQIVTEEVNENPPCENFVPENVTESRDDKKKSVRVESATKGNEGAEGYDNTRILAAMAKMEKRRERFKEPITLQKENDLMIPKPQVDPIVVAMETKQQRPARKRRWGGS